MTCHERLAHALEIDKIKIYPNHQLVVEKTKKKQIYESYLERKAYAKENNEYSSLKDDKKTVGFFGISLNLEDATYRPKHE